MKYQYSIPDYIASIEREQAKRATTYPKMIEKMGKNSADKHEILEIFGAQGDQLFNLNQVKKILLDDDETIDSMNEFAENVFFKYDMIYELIREYKMRKRTYPRWIFLDKNRKDPRITQEIADFELSVWRELCVYFAETFLGDPQIALDMLDTKKRKCHHAET